jgi:uroporphyrinogen decarboxylase
MSNLINVFKKENKDIPIWLMRQAGRYLPEYMEIRSNVDNFLELCYDSDKAAKVTLQPIDRFGFDAAILFSDILVLPHALGWNVAFKKGEGPILEKFKSEKDLLKLSDNFSDQINNVYSTVSKVKSSLPKHVSLIGFAGSPWTVISYMLEGKGKQDFSVSKGFLYNDYQTAKKLFDIISDKTIEYLSGQIEAGAEIIQLFDSWSGMLNGFNYEEFVIKPTKKIVDALKQKYPNVPIIGFPRGSGYNYDNYIKNTKIDGVGVDQFTPVSQMKKWQKDLVVQGNFDPVILLGGKENIKNAVDEILYTVENENFIFNLGHGIMPNTDPKNVEYLVKCVREFKR